MVLANLLSRDYFFFFFFFFLERDALKVSLRYFVKVALDGGARSSCCYKSYSQDDYECTVF